MILSGEIYSTEELHRMGVVDILGAQGRRRGRRAGPDPHAAAFAAPRTSR